MARESSGVPAASGGHVSPDSSLWDYSLAVYRNDAVAKACLELQTRLDADVNVLLYCLWTSATGRGGLEDVDIAAALAATADWRDSVIRPLRAIRTLLREDVGAVSRDRVGPTRDLVKTAELEAERVEQHLLESGARRKVERVSDEAALATAAASIGRYIAMLEVLPGREGLEAVVELLSATFPSSTTVAVRAVVRRTMGATAFDDMGYLPSD
jgi:uncharacterized protein (TIGR02444 family)